MADKKSSPKIGFVGGGKMAQAMLNGFIKSGEISAASMVVSNRSAKPFAALTEMGVKTTHVNSEVVTACDVVFFGVKPYQIRDVLREVSPKINVSRHLVVSIAAGVTTKSLEECLPAGTRVVRVGTNLPCVVQEGCNLLVGGSKVTEGDLVMVRRLLTYLGGVEDVAESQINAINAVSGCGPAYAFAAIEALADGGVKMGVPRDVAQRQAAQMMLGAAKMVLASNKHPGQLKDEVCSPGGATIEGMAVLEKGGFRSCLISAVEAGALKAKAMGGD